MPDGKLFSFDWAFWFLWIMATTWGWILGQFLFPAIGLVAAGFGIGVFQWLVLNQRIRGAWRWILASTIGWMAGWAITLVLVPTGFGFLSGLVLGAATGTAQWLILRHELHWTGWWIPVSALAWTTGLTLFSGVFIAGVMAGTMSGIALGLLLCYPKLVEADE